LNVFVIERAPEMSRRAIITMAPLDV